MTISNIISTFTALAPESYQESYDNSGLLTGNQSMECTGVLISLDCIESIIDEAIAANCNLIVAHHPIIFSGLKKINGKNYIERTIIKAIKNDIAIYAIHTNLDNVTNGVNTRIADRLGLIHQQILAPKSNTFSKLITFIPKEIADAVSKAGCGHIGNYSEAGFSTNGTGTFKGDEHSNPLIGKPNVLESVSEVRFETIFPSYMQYKVIAALKQAHPYEEVAYDIISLQNSNQNVGLGMIGDLEVGLDSLAFLSFLKEKMKTKVIRHSALVKDQILKVAVCGGSGAEFLPYAIAQGADIYITGDNKYHQFFDAEDKIIIADIGHYESEQFTIDLIFEYLSEKFPTFALQKSKIDTNPVNYYF
jgi:dinuclear metal center YbgI/SA1388 family protein